MNKLLFVLVILLSCAGGKGNHRDASPSVPHAAPRFLNGDVANAIAVARREKKTHVFVELWACWCPPCMAMRANAFDDPSVAALPESIMWVSVDRDSDEG